MSQLFLIYTVAALMDLSMAATLFALTRRAAELHGSAIDLGLLGAIMFGVYSVCTPLAGRVSDRMGRRTMALIGSSLGAVTVMACAFTTKVPWLAGWTAVFGLSIGMFWPSIIAWAGGGLRGPALALRMSRFSVSWNIGLLMGFGLSGELFERGPRFAFFCASGALVLISLLLSFSSGTVAESPVPVPVSDVPIVPKGRGFRKTAWMSNFGMLFAVSGMLSLFPQLATHLGIRANLHGGLLVLHRCAALGFTILWPHVRFWQTRLWPLWIAQGACALAVLGVGLGTNVWQFGAALMVCGAMLGFNYQASLFFTLEEMSGKGEGSGIHEAMLGAGGFLGLLLAGWVGNHYSMRAPYLFCATCLAGWIVVQMGMVAWRRTARASAGNVRASGA